MIIDNKENINNNGWNLEFGELTIDVDFASKCENLSYHLEKVEKTLDKVLPLKAHFDKLPVNQQIEIDLFILYALNSLWWINLRLSGVDMTNHPIKRELQRIQNTMNRWKEIKERKFRPTVNVDVANRFVRSGLYDITQNANGTPPPNKKTRLEDNDE